MKKLKTFEELSPGTYTSAAEKLRKLGHVKRPNDIISWKEESAKRALIKEVSVIGQYDIDIYFDYNNNNMKSGKFYLNLFMNKDMLYDQMNYWKRHDYTEITYLPIEIELVPVDEESKSIIENNSYSKDGSHNLDFFLWVNISQNYLEVSDSYLYEYGIKKPKDVSELKGDIYPSGIVNLESHSDLTMEFSNRKSALKFKKSLADIFDGKIDYNAVIDGELINLKEGVTDELFDEYELGIPSLLRFIKSTKKIRVNSLYSD